MASSKLWGSYSNIGGFFFCLGRVEALFNNLKSRILQKAQARMEQDPVIMGTMCTGKHYLLMTNRHCSLLPQGINMEQLEKGWKPQTHPP